MSCCGKRWLRSSSDISCSEHILVHYQPGFKCLPTSSSSGSTASSLSGYFPTRGCDRSPSLACLQWSLCNSPSSCSAEHSSCLALTVAPNKMANPGKLPYSRRGFGKRLFPLLVFFYLQFYFIFSLGKSLTSPGTTILSVREQRSLVKTPGTTILS